ncbi:MAG: RluA family pseudouridine synthase [Clostridiales bacterium]|nr:RluA family pseudouridine synthase [Clostridiales bacterium]
MYQKQITDREAGQRFDKYLHKLLPEAGSSFLYKMLRKKNIILNGRKADGSEKIAAGDQVAIFFSEETLRKFMGRDSGGSGDRCEEFYQAYQKYSSVPVIYENEHILLANKPAGLLSQKAKPEDLSLNEWLIGYLLRKDCIKEEDIAAFKPSVCNRLDRNTSGIVLCAKSLKGARLLGALLQNRSLHKYYQLYVKGRVTREQLIEGYLRKDEKHNKVSVTPLAQSAGEPEEAYIQTRYKPLKVYADMTLLEAELLTGKPHQIRAHLAGVGHPLLGDYKYGNRAWNDRYQKEYHIKSQLLHAYKVTFPTLGAPFEDISGQTFYAQPPEIFETIARHQEAYRIASGRK